MRVVLGQNQTISPSIGQNIKVTLGSDQNITSAAPITLRDTRADYNEIDKLLDVDLTTRANNSTLVYNALTDRYEVKPVAQALPSLDGGTF